jgi:superfamily I DNA/RNA helicase
MDTLRSASGHLSVRALAGTGKTTTIELCQPIRSGLNIAFNKNVRLAFQDRMPGATNHTFNSYGHYLINQNLGRPRFDAKKLWHIFDEMNLRGQLGDLRRLVDMGRNAGIGPSSHSLSKHTDFEVWDYMISEHELDIEEKHRVQLPSIIKRCWELACDRIIDFGDQNWCPVVMNLSLGRPFGTVYIDEAQDINALQQSLILRLAQRDQIVLVGDPHQAIYGFRGSISGAMATLEQRLGIPDPLPLSVSYRCPKAVVEVAQQWVPEFSAHESAPEGTVTEHKEWDHTSIPIGSTILCRNNAKLVPIALYLLSKERGATIKGSEIGKGLAKLARSIDKASSPKTPADFIKAVEAWFQANYEKPNAEDKANSLIALIRGLNTANGETLANRVQWLFSDEAGLITLSTIHKAKGLEWKSVFMLDRHLIPSRFARTPEQFQQEENLLYVGVTRSKDSLGWISTDGLR